MSYSREDSFDGAMTRSAVVLDPGLLPPEIAITEDRDPDRDYQYGEENEQHDEHSQNKLGATLRRIPSAVSIESKNFASRITRSPVVDPFTGQSLFFCFFAIGLYLLDYGTDIAVAISLYNEEQEENVHPEHEPIFVHWWFVLTVVFISVPLVIVNVFSLVWFAQEHQIRGAGVGFVPRPKEISSYEKALVLVAHLFLLGPVIRQGYIIYWGLRERRHRQASSRREDEADFASADSASNEEHHMSKSTPYTVRKFYERDSAYLGLLDCFLQDGPQLILQLYILSVRHTGHPDDEEASARSEWQTVFFQCFSVLTSLLCVTSSMVAYEGATRWADPRKPNLSVASSLLQLLWRFCVVASRVVALAVFATIFPSELFIFMALHWLLMVVWIVAMGTNFCGSIDNVPRPASEFVYNLVIGWVFVFDSLHVKEGPTRLKQAVYYTLMAAELCALLSLWYMQAKDLPSSSGATPPTALIEQVWFHSLVLALAPSLFVLGVVFMMAYYAWYHPTGKHMPDHKHKPQLF